MNVLLCTSHHNLLMDTDCFQLQKRCRAWLVNHLSDLSNLSIRKFLDCGYSDTLANPTFIHIWESLGRSSQELSKETLSEELSQETSVSS